MYAISMGEITFQGVHNIMENTRRCFYTKFRLKGYAIFVKFHF